MKTTQTPKMTLPCGAGIASEHLDGSTLVTVFLTNLSPGSIITTKLPGVSSVSEARINIALENLPDLAKLIQKYLPKKSRKRKKVR